MRDGSGQCGQSGLPWAEKSAVAASIAGQTGPAEIQESAILLGFRHGMAFAEEMAWVESRCPRGVVWSPAMLFALGAASSAIDALKALTSSKSSSTQSSGLSQDATGLFDFSGGTSASTSASTNTGSGGSGGQQISPDTMSVLLAAQSQSTGTASSAPTSRSSALKDLFSQIDADGDGKITKSEFENALGAGGTNLAQADDVFSKLDKDGDGSVSLGEMASALKGANGKGHRHQNMAAGSGATTGTDGASSDPLLQALGGASSSSVTNSDGSTTTTLTYADGSKVTMTSAASSSASGSATSSYHFIEQLIQRQASTISAQANASLSVTA
jgi:hypothetical protein